MGVMEAGKRWSDQDIPRTQWDLRRFLWLPAAQLYGIQRLEYLDDVLVLATGSAPSPLPGADPAAAVHTLRSLDHGRVSEVVSGMVDSINEAAR